MNPLTVEEVRALLVRAVEEKGADYVYPEGERCANHDGHGNPLCIAGHVYHYMGVKTRQYAPVSWVNDDHGLFTSRAAKALVDAQCAQDDGQTWGEALAAFDDAVGVMPDYLANLIVYIVGPLTVIAVVAFVLTVILEGP